MFACILWSYLCCVGRVVWSVLLRPESVSMATCTATIRKDGDSCCNRAI